MTQITIDRALVEQALRALEKHQEALRVWPEHTLAPHECVAMDVSGKAITAFRTALAQQDEPVAERERIASQWDGCVTHRLDTFGPVDIGASIRAGELVGPAQQAEPKGGGNLPPPLQTHCPNCAGPETQNTELDRKAAFAKRGEALYHPCTYILILGLKKLNAYDVLAEWDKARAEVDALAPRQTEKVK